MNHKRLIRFDWAMKTLLRDKANFDILEGFLSALLEDENITILNILESETNPIDDDDKFIRVDLLVEDSQKRKIYIEIQNSRETDFLHSLLYASSKIIVENQKLGSDFSDVVKVISISILYYNLGIGNDYIYYGKTDFTGLNTGEPLQLRNREEITTAFEPKYRMVEKNIFPEYYIITVERYQNIIKKQIDEWLYIFKNNEVADGSHSRNIDKAEQKLAEMNMSETERKRYEKYMYYTVRDRDAYNTGIRETDEKARKEEKIIITKGMIKKGFENELIEELTSLTDEQINEIRNELNNQ